MAAAVEFVFAKATAEQLPAIQALEAASYPADEAASADALEFRMRVAGDFFYAARDGTGELVAFVCGTTTTKDRLEEDSMATHEDGGHVLCIHSVVTAPAWRRKGVATWAVKAYMAAVCAEHGEVSRFALLSKDGNVPLYTRCGFASLGPSPVVHGEDTWYDMVSLASPAAACLAQVTVDAFAKAAFSGNPAAVVVLPGAGSLPPAVNAEDEATALMQALAGENNLSETAFLQQDTADAARWLVRWFTPTTEVTLCGHATLAAAATLWQEGHLPACQPAVRLLSASGPLSVSRGADGSLTMDFPELPLTLMEMGQVDAVPAALTEAMGMEVVPTAVCRSELDILVALTPEQFAALPPQGSVNMPPLQALGGRGVIVTARGEGGPVADGDAVLAAPPAFVSRFFAPAAGVPEDPVTGSAHCALAGFWAQKDAPGAWLHGHQASARGGHVGVSWRGDTGRVLLRGTAVPTLSSRLSPELSADFRKVCGLPVTPGAAKATSGGAAQ